MRIESWRGQEEKSTIEYEFSHNENKVTLVNGDVVDPDVIQIYNNEDFLIKADKYDCLIAVSSGILTGALDAFWVGDFSLREAQNIGREQISEFVIQVAKSMGFKKDELKAAIRFLEDRYPVAADKLTDTFGGGLQHHLRDFSHHASPFGLICSILIQFTGKAYGTDKDGNHITSVVPDCDRIGTNFEEKIMYGVLYWAFHLVSDMAGSSSSAGAGTGIPGPMLSMAKVLSATPLFKEISVKYKDDEIGFSVWISKLFNGTAFAHTNHKDAIRFDLRTEIGITEFGLKQAIPVIINQCIVRSFYFIRRLAYEISFKGVTKLSDIKKLEPKNFLPTNSKCMIRMLTISTGTFTVVDTADSAIRAKFKSTVKNSSATSDMLVRMNFIGIGAFALSIKNEVKYMISDAKAMMSKKTKYESIVMYQSIDMEVEMDNRNLYEYTFKSLLNIITLNRNRLLLDERIKLKSEMGKLISLGDGYFDAYKSFVENSEISTVKCIEELVVNMCQQNNISFGLYPVDSRHQSLYYTEQKKSRPFQIVMYEEGIKVGYIFSNYNTPKFIEEFKQQQYKVDALKIIMLSAPKNDTYNTLITERNDSNKQRGLAVQYETIEELFDRLFGVKEYEIFLNYLNAFNSKAKEIIGFNTILSPTDEAIKNFKKTVGKMLVEYPYHDCIPSDVFGSQVEILFNNYIERSLWRAMVGHAPFAVSFVSSEWNYSVYQLTNNLDLTGIIAGYLKSIEQLLFAVIQLSKDKGISIKARDGRILDYSTDTEELIDTTLGSLEAVIQHNGFILDVNHFVKRHIVDTIKGWREKQRNGYFHKHNLHSAEKVEEIRQKAIYLYFLILGACTVDDAQFSQLGVCEEKDTIVSFDSKDFVKWLEPIIKYNIPKEAVGISFNLYRDGDKKWSLQFIATNRFDENDDKWTCSEIFSSGRDLLVWHSTKSEIDIVNEVSSAIKEYIENGRYSGELIKYSAIAVTYPRKTQIVYKHNN